ncbi:MAG: SUF system NifU family Fe-S cluster assembly protein [Actinobacteria bacterium]|nr:SUF system NifU family Fe-S cluster assembly protein [Candidatus Planktophila sp.]PHX66865.1 MAG: SUF system NifU family Fe-S cluster assembly protein [Actinomycetota bacterium]
MQLDSLYQEVILDHYKHPQHKGLSPTFSAQVSHVNASCGDEIILNINLEGDLISELTWDGQGCSISQASVSIMTDLLTGKTLDQAAIILKSFSDLMASKGTSPGDELVLEDAIAFAGVSKFPGRIKCSLLGWMAFKDAAIQAQSRK